MHAFTCHLFRIIANQRQPILTILFDDHIIKGSPSCKIINNWVELLIFSESPVSCFFETVREPWQAGEWTAALKKKNITKIFFWNNWKLSTFTNSGIRDDKMIWLILKSTVPLIQKSSSMQIYVFSVGLWLNTSRCWTYRKPHRLAKHIVTGVDVFYLFLEEVKTIVISNTCFSRWGANPEIY